MAQGVHLQSIRLPLPQELQYLPLRQALIHQHRANQRIVQPRAQRLDPFDSFVLPHNFQRFGNQAVLLRILIPRDFP